MRYLRDIYFYFLEFVGGLVNLLCALFGIYPKLELGIIYLMRKQSLRVEEEVTDTQKKRKKKEQQALEKSNEANRLSDG